MLEVVKTSDHVVSRTLADEVKRKVRERGLVLWLDAERHYCDLVDTMSAGAYEFTYPVLSYRGSYLDSRVTRTAIAQNTCWCICRV